MQGINSKITQTEFVQQVRFADMMEEVVHKVEEVAIATFQDGRRWTRLKGFNLPPPPNFFVDHFSCSEFTTFHDPQPQLKLLKLYYLPNT
jgi:hypothetical protein